MPKEYQKPELFVFGEVNEDVITASDNDLEDKWGENLENLL